MRIAANEDSSAFNSLLIEVLNWSGDENIRWCSPIQEDDFAEYYDDSFLERLDLRDLKVPLADFWPRRGARWDALAKTDTGKVILVEAKAYIEEGVDYGSKARNPSSIAKISKSLHESKKAFSATDDASWDAPFYQYTNRLAHLYFLRKLNNIDAYLVFLYFANAPDVSNPCTEGEWLGAERLIKKAIGLSNHPFRDYMTTLIWNVPEMPSNL